MCLQTAIRLLVIYHPLAIHVTSSSTVATTTATQLLNEQEGIELAIGSLALSLVHTLNYT